MRIFGLLIGTMLMASLHSGGSWGCEGAGGGQMKKRMGEPRPLKRSYGGVDVEDNGVIFTYKVDGSGPYTALTDAADDSRQPVWSPSGDKIVFQRQEGGQWDVWTMNTDGSGQAAYWCLRGKLTDHSLARKWTTPRANVEK